jgi:hypothetical protein
MFYVLTLTYALIDIYTLIKSQTISYDAIGQLSQLQLLIGVTLGMMAAINTNPKRKATMVILCFGALSIFVTRACFYAPDYVYYAEIFVYCFGLLWASFRPYNFISDRLTEDTVCLLFYKADKGSWLMNVLSLIGLPVSSMSIVCGNEWLRLVLARPTLEIHPVSNISNKYIIVDTGVKIDSNIKRIFRSLKGIPAINAKSLFLRVRCIAAVKPLLKQLGQEWYPKTVFQQIPSTYFYKALWNRQQRTT